MMAEVSSWLPYGDRKLWVNGVNLCVHYDQGNHPYGHGAFGFSRLRLFLSRGPANFDGSHAALFEFSPAVAWTRTVSARLGDTGRKGNDTVL